MSQRKHPLSPSLRRPPLVSLPSGIVLGMALALSNTVSATEPQNTAVSVQRQMLEFNIAAQPLDRAALAFAEQAGLQVFFDSARLQGLSSRGLQGRYTVDEAIRELLGATPVSYHFSGPRQITLSRSVQTDDQAIQLPTITVVDEGARYTASDLQYHEPRSVSVITREQIERTPPRHAADMLEESTGVYTAVSQQDPGLSVNIRGIQDYGRVNMNIDGMRQNYQQSGHQQRNGTMYVDPELLGGVTVEKGASSGMGGAGVIGGVAEFSTLNARDFIHEGKEFGGQFRATSGLGDYANGTNFIGSGVFAMGNDIGDFLIAASERHLGDFDPGTKGSIGELRTGSWSNPDIEDRIKNSPVDYSGFTMRSQLAKLGLNLPHDQRMQFSYLRTQVSYDDANMLDTDNEALWEKLGDSNIVSQNFALDYNYAPDNPLIDVKAKLYLVDTRNDQSNLARGSSQAYDVTYKTITYGLQAENISSFTLSENSILKANYGLEVFHDKVSPDSNQAVASSSAVDYPSAEGLTPSGTRTMASLFTRLDYEYSDWLNLNAGLRYDRYRLRGETGMNIRTFILGTTQQTNEPLLFDVDREEGRFSPTVGISVSPGVDWIQLFANYGKGWRPPSVTETLVTGSHSTGSSTMYPNPFLEPERSTTWEAGVNIFREGLFTSEDRLGIKVAYFDTKIDDFMFMGYGLRRPGYQPIATIGTAAYVNNLETTRFRGVEYSLDYDAGSYYGNLSYTHMIGNNDYCKLVTWLGGSMDAVSAGSRQPITAMVPNEANNQQISCGGGIMGTAEHMPMDRGSLTLGARLLERKLDLGMRARYSAGYYLTVNDDERVDMTYPADWKPYTVYDIFGRYQVNQNLALHFSIDNLTDRAYLVPLGDVLAFTLGRGRTVQGGVAYRF
ncbi:Hemophore HasA outer membrane receptor HasR [Nitrincola lacisaponensis]|uniref:Hemophore HasA outer membrane receptor HasR n=1 Tax=Nitrincola lacisaponensis TaxID=267850 RepID=A0A063Y6L4_9GAMM|nr:TonB-dependent receptor [Nitrincola lacisaponensis]KDE40062.1 Hemophore HasA outer membrane receptor HasR [Nitrincola lacisaponensis]